jgi:hypothetical protein
MQKILMRRVQELTITMSYVIVEVSTAKGLTEESLSAMYDVSWMLAA